MDYDVDDDDAAGPRAKETKGVVKRTYWNASAASEDIQQTE